MEKSNSRRNTETPMDQDNFSHTSGSSVSSDDGKINTNRLSVHDLTAERIYLEPTDPNK